MYIFQNTYLEPAWFVYNVTCIYVYRADLLVLVKQSVCLLLSLSEFFSSLKFIVYLRPHVLGSPIVETSF